MHITRLKIKASGAENKLIEIDWIKTLFEDHIYFRSMETS